MFGRNKKREGYELIEVAEDGPSSSLRDLPLRLAATPSTSEMEPLVRVGGVTNKPTYYDSPLIAAEGDDDDSDSEQRQSVSVENRWEHVGNPDQFFTRFYEYHQGGGFVCIVAEHIFSLIQYLFIVSFATFLFECVDYPVLFNDKNITADGSAIVGKRHLKDAIISDCVSRFNPLVVALLLIAVIFWIFLFARAGYHIFQFMEIRSFYRKALGVGDDQLVNLTWYEVLWLLCQKLPQLHVVITKDRLTQLDVYQRILRFKNYFIALVNKELLPPVLNVPFIGPLPYLSNGLKLNLEFLLFWGTWSPWDGPYTLREEYKNSQNIPQLTMELQQSATILGLVNLLLMPFVFIYQVLYTFFSYVELAKRDPSAFGARRYSNYGRNKLRHFNELDHELLIRLSRSHRAATQYMNLFVSPFVEVVAKNVKFMAGSFFAVFFILTAWDEDVLTLEHVLTAMTLSFLIVMVCNSLISSENRIYLPEQLMRIIISQIHYAPQTWEGKAHTQTVRKEFDHLFPLTANYILEELLSPLLTPLVLLFWVRPRARQFVEFFNRYTVSVEGLGDVCSFAQMDVALHGDSRWVTSTSPDAAATVSDEEIRETANDGKTELSLLHFATLNPDWQPPAASAHFLNDLRARVQRDMRTISEADAEDNLLLASINSLVDPYVPASFNISGVPGTDAARVSFIRPPGVGVNHLDGPPSGSNSMLASLHQAGQNRPQLAFQNNGVYDERNLCGAAGEMAVNTLYLRQLAGLNEAVEDSVVRRPANVTSRSRAFAESSCIWGVPSQENVVADSTMPGLFAHRVRATEH